MNKIYSSNPLQLLYHWNMLLVCTGAKVPLCALWPCRDLWHQQEGCPPTYLQVRTASSLSTPPFFPYLSITRINSLAVYSLLWILGRGGEEVAVSWLQWRASLLEQSGAQLVFLSLSTFRWQNKGKTSRGWAFWDQTHPTWTITCRHTDTRGGGSRD